jgi:NADPH2:quinone reductase
MKAVVITRHGGPEVLQVREVPDPQPGPGEVRVEVASAALNRADLLQRRGLYPAPPGCPEAIPGLEFAGRVEVRGAGVRRLRVGDRVMGIVGGGGYAERLVVHEKLCMPLPPALSWDEAAAFPEAFLTAFDALWNQARLTPGESMLLHAAASGVGTAAAQLGAVAGARVIGLCRSSSKRRQLKELGVQFVFDPEQPQLADEILAAAGGEGVDLVVDLLGAASWNLNVTALRPQGRLVLLGLLGGSRAEVDLSVLLAKRLSVVGSVLRPRSLDERIRLVRQFNRSVIPLLAAGRVRPVIDRVFDWTEAVDAHRRMEANLNYGKIVLSVRR